MFDDTVAFASGFEGCLFDTISLHELVEVFLVAPLLIEVVVLQFAGIENADDVTASKSRTSTWIVTM